ncbi:MAG: hypothetical protein MHMPM18_002177 [Marteilia pararefringens]
MFDYLLIVEGAALVIIPACYALMKLCKQNESGIERLRGRVIDHVMLWLPGSDQPANGRKGIDVANPQVFPLSDQLVDNKRETTTAV